HTRCLSDWSSDVCFRSQRDGWRRIVSEKAVYVYRDSNGHLCALSSVCPHLGCSIAWHDDKNKFICPCHNGQFAADGKLLGGPPRSEERRGGKEGTQERE